MNKNTLLLLTILIEGYVVLASELLAIRLLIPFVGSSTEVISIIISAVLMPLAVGYHVGGQRYNRAVQRYKQGAGRFVSVRKILLRNLISAMFVLMLGLSYPFISIFFYILTKAGIDTPIAQAAIYSCLFLVIPTFLLAQTVPLISNYFSQSSLSEITGKMLFFSTTGSFFGSVFSTIVLMTHIGVHHTVMVTIGLLLLLIVLLTRRIYDFDNVMAGFVFLVVCLLNSNVVIRDAMKIVSNNQYSTVAIHPKPEIDGKLMDINNSASSIYSPHPEKRAEYAKYIERNIILPRSRNDDKKRVLVIGAGGFTIGLDDEYNEYVYVDIDKSLKEVSEKYFLPKKLGDNKEFVAASARAFLKRETTKYDVVILDAYTNIHSIPMEATTKEFFADVKAVLLPGGVVVSNVLSSPDYRDLFTARYYNTFQSVFPKFNRQIIGEYNPWVGTKIRNTLLIYFDRPTINDDVIYTDDLNTFFMDR